MRRKWTIAPFIVLLAGGGWAGRVLADGPSPPPPLTTTILAKSTLGPLLLRGHSMPRGAWAAKLKTRGLSDFYVVDNKFGVGTTTGWHSHPGPSVIFVAAGTVTNYDSDDPRCAPQRYSAGSSFVDSGGTDVHMLRNESSAPAETIAVQFLPMGAARKTDAAEPANCHI